MNNRIRELAQEAGILYGTAVEYYYTRATDGVVSRQMEKFAELIVRECSMLYQSIDNGNRPHGTDDYLTALKLHLGIKE